MSDQQSQPQTPELHNTSALDESFVGYANEILSERSIVIPEFTPPTLEAQYVKESNYWNKFYIVFGIKLTALSMLLIIVLYAFLKPEVYENSHDVSFAIIQVTSILLLFGFVGISIRSDLSQRLKQLSILVYIIGLNGLFLIAPFNYQETSLSLLFVLVSPFSLVFAAYLYRLTLPYLIVFFVSVFALSVWMIVKYSDSDPYLLQVYFFGCIVPTILVAFMSVYQQTVHRTHFLSKILLEYHNRHLNTIAYEDALTNLANRRRFNDYFKQEWAHLSRRDDGSEPLSLMLIDIDSFKHFNDFYGHQLGDSCLQSVAAALKANFMRQTDLVARFGGEEFVIVLPNTSANAAQAMAEKAREAVANLAIAHDASTVAETKTLTVSIGVATAERASDYEHANTLIQQADVALYDAKKAGRNRVVQHRNQLDK